MWAGVLVFPQVCRREWRGRGGEGRGSAVSPPGRPEWRGRCRGGRGPADSPPGRSEWRGRCSGANVRPELTGFRTAGGGVTARDGGRLYTAGLHARSGRDGRARERVVVSIAGLNRAGVADRASVPAALARTGPARSDRHGSARAPATLCLPTRSIGFRTRNEDPTPCLAHPARSIRSRRP